MFFDYRAFAKHHFFFILGSYPRSAFASFVQIRLFSTSQHGIDWHKAGVWAAWHLVPFLPAPSFSPSRKSSVIIKFSGFPRNPRGHTSFWHTSYAIHVAFPSWFLYLNTTRVKNTIKNYWLLLGIKWQYNTIYQDLSMGRQLLV